MAGDDQSHTAHRPAKKEKAKSSGQPNPKAFAFNAPGKLLKNAARSGDVKEKRLHVPLVDRLPEEAPPLVVGVVGPPGVGKTTLIKSLVKKYTKQTISQPQGPITIVTSKKRRLTFFEVPSDSLASAIDTAKVVDIVLLMIDGNFGFEMETMEFLNVLSSSGMPGNIFGILTHLDLFRKQDALKAQKKRLKHRFWSELYQGAKLFYLSGVINGRYPDREILNLSRFLSVMKNPRPLVWRNSHPYALADRMLDLTPPTAIEQDAKCDRTVALYGYLRGTNFPSHNARVHVPGIGDLEVSQIESLPDPCPTPQFEQAQEKAGIIKKRRKLDQKQKVIYAPMSDVGGVLMDKDAVYIDVKSNNFDLDSDDEGERGFGEQMMVGLQGGKKMLGEDNQGISLFGKGMRIQDVEEEDNVQDTGRKGRRTARFAEEGDGDAGESPDDEGFVSADSDDDADLERLQQAPEKLGSARKNKDKEVEGDIAFADSDSDLGSISSVSDQELEDGDELDDEEYSDDDDDGETRWKSRLAEHAHLKHSRKQPYRVAELARMMYDDMLSAVEVVRKWRGDDADEADKEDEEEDELFERRRPGLSDEEDRMVPAFDDLALEDKWTNEENIDALKKRFAARAPTGVNGEGLGESFEGFDGEGDDEDEGDGEFEDLEAGDGEAGDKDGEKEAEDLETLVVKKN
jgi:ribosome biogenesis protein BMS1